MQEQNQDVSQKTNESQEGQLPESFGHKPSYTAADVASEKAKSFREGYEAREKGLPMEVDA